MKRRSLLAASLALPVAARAQQWPTHPIRMIVAYAPGATGDILGRLFGEELGKTFGQTIVIDNKTGAGGTIAMAETGRAPPDGYTLAVVAQGLLVYNLGLYKNPDDPKKVTFDKPGRVDVFCSIHSSMSCVVLVLENPFFAITNDKGAYSITNVPAGVYKLKAWHERLPAQVREITVPETGEVHVDFTLGITGLPKY